MSRSPEPLLCRILAGAGFRTGFLLAMLPVVAAITATMGRAALKSLFAIPVK